MSFNNRRSNLIIFLTERLLLLLFLTESFAIKVVTNEMFDTFTQNSADTIVHSLFNPLLIYSLFALLMSPKLVYFCERTSKPQKREHWLFWSVVFYFPQCLFSFEMTYIMMTRQSIWMTLVLLSIKIGMVIFLITYIGQLYSIRQVNHPNAKAKLNNVCCGITMATLLTINVIANIFDFPAKIYVMTLEVIVFAISIF